jgi:hypothetical protein
MKAVIFALIITGAGVVDQRWRSERCGPRHWPRTLFFAADGGFTALDEVAPCPAGAACVWSGIDQYVGSWADGAHERTLTITAGHHVGTLPTRFTLNATGAPVEIFDGGSCVFSSLK